MRDSAIRCSRSDGSDVVDLSIHKVSVSERLGGSTGKRVQEKGGRSCRVAARLGDVIIASTGSFSALRRSSSSSKACCPFSELFQGRDEEERAKERKERKDTECRRGGTYLLLGRYTILPSFSEDLAGEVCPDHNLAQALRKKRKEEEREGSASIRTERGKRRRGGATWCEIGPSLMNEVRR